MKSATTSLVSCVRKWGRRCRSQASVAIKIIKPLSMSTILKGILIWINEVQWSFLSPRFWISERFADLPSSLQFLGLGSPVLSKVMRDPSHHPFSKGLSTVNHPAIGIPAPIPGNLHLEMSAAMDQRIKVRHVARHNYCHSYHLHVDVQQSTSWLLQFTLWLFYSNCSLLWSSYHYHLYTSVFPLWKPP